MALTTRKNITDQIIVAMGQIRDLVTVDNRPNADDDPYSVDECPALNIKEGDDYITPTVSNDEHELKVSFEIHTSSRVTSDAIENLLGDIAAKIYDTDTWGGYADGTAIESYVISNRQTGDVITAGFMEIIIRYTTDKGKI